MSIPAAVPPPNIGGLQSKGGPRAKRDAQNRKYGTPLPLLLPESALYKMAARMATPASSSSSSSVLTASTAPTLLAGKAAAVITPVVGDFDAASQSVWVSGQAEMETLFNRGFFGKGTLSRSEPSWHARRADLVRGGSALAAEQIREKRRKERKQFKIDRAAAMLEAAMKAEAVLTTGQMPEGYTVAGDEASTPAAEDAEEDNPAEAEGAGEENVETPVDAAERPASPAPSTMSLATDAASVSVAPTSLTAQTFLVRPTRPDANRNRGKKTFRRRPPPQKPNAAAGTAGEVPGAAGAPGAPAQDGAAAPSAPTPAPPRRTPAPRAPEPEADDSASEDEAAALVPEMEHLQLNLQEALFLGTLGVLKIRDPATDTIIPVPALLSRLLTPLELTARPLIPPTALYPDDPLLVSYAAYHHYRALGWCVRDGIKFCVDWLLYRRGPVFSHSAFSILMVPVYMDSEDQGRSPHGNSDWYAERMSWKWMNTIMRVNSLVMKTVIVAYITIPSISSFPARARLPGGGLDPRYFDLRSLMGHYSVREVSLMRFGPARRRD